MDKAPLLCRIKSNIIRKSPSAIMAGCNFGIFPSGKCIGCPEYNAWWEEFEWSILKMVELKPEQIKAAEAILAKGDRVELIPAKDGVRVMRVRRETVAFCKEVREKPTATATWIRTNRGLKDGFIEWECSKCGFIPNDSLLYKKCEKCGSIMKLGNAE